MDYSSLATMNKQCSPTGKSPAKIGFLIESQAHSRRVSSLRVYKPPEVQTSTHTLPTPKLASVVLFRVPKRHSKVTRPLQHRRLKYIWEFKAYSPEFDPIRLVYYVIESNYEICHLLLPAIFNFF